MFVAKPTKQQLQWYDLGFGVLIHYLPLQDGELVIANMHGDLTTYNPPRLDPEQWVRSAWKAGAKYAVLVAKQCSFASWPTDVNDCSIASSIGNFTHFGIHTCSNNNCCTTAVNDG